MKWWLVFVGMVLAACSTTATTPQPVAVAPTESPARAMQIASDPQLTAGEQVYFLRCAHCHGYTGEGQLASTVPNTQSLGLHTVPPHDATGHTWQHPDQLLLEVIAKGIQNPLDHYPMPAFETVVTPAEMEQVLAYIKLWWTPEQHEYQARLTDNHAKLMREFGTE